MTTLNAPQPAPMQRKADMATLRMALRKMHRRACGDESAVYMSIPADRERDADLLLEDALDELANYRALEAPTLNAPQPPQPPPVTDDAGPEVWPALLAEVALSPELRALCEERDAMGRAKYGTPLMVNNGREPLVDALQEALDLVVYLHQAEMRIESHEELDVARRWHLVDMRDEALKLAESLLEEVTP